MKRLTVQFTDGQWKLIKNLEIGNTNAEKVRNIVISWLAEKSIISDTAKKRIKDLGDKR